VQKYQISCHLPVDHPSNWIKVKNNSVERNTPKDNEISSNDSHLIYYTLSTYYNVILSGK
jgi:hypothetical protein